MRNLKKGFTLVELIVVITILAVLATIAFITLGDYPVKSRDSKRQSQVSALFQKLIAENATWYKVFIENKTVTDLAANSSLGNSKKPSNMDIENPVSLSWDIDFIALKESKDAFADTKDSNNNPYKVFTARWDERIWTEVTKRSCHAIKLSWEQKDAEKTDCPSYITISYQ